MPSRYFGQSFWLAPGVCEVVQATICVRDGNGSADTTRRRQLALAVVFQPLGALPASGRKVDQLGVANQAAAISGPFFSQIPQIKVQVPELLFPRMLNELQPRDTKGKAKTLTVHFIEFGQCG